MAHKKTSGEISAKIQSLSLGSEEAAAALYCQPCELDKKQVPAYGYCKNCAEHLCEECYRTHRRPAPSRGHVLLDSYQMPQSKGPGQSLIETCAVHKGEAIKYHCKNHDIFGCDLCIAINHNYNCQKLNVNEAAKDFQLSQEYQNMFQEIEKVKTMYEEVNKSVKENMQLNQTSRESIKDQITTLRKEINHKLDQWEQDLRKHNDSIHERENLKATTALYDSRDVLQKVEQLQENLTRLQAAGSKINLYIQAKKDQKTLKDYKERLEKMKSEANNVVRYSFARSCDVDNLCYRIGNISEKRYRKDNQSKFYN